MDTATNNQKWESVILEDVTSKAFVDEIIYIGDKTCGVMWHENSNSDNKRF